LTDTIAHPPAPTRPARSLRGLLPDVGGVLWTVVAAALTLWPALRSGVSLGPFDLLSQFGLTHQAGVVVHNSVQADQIRQFVPWTGLAWHQVHNGQLPLWNPYNVLGTPLAFNWQSSVFSVPTLVSYFFPVRYAYTVVVLGRLVLAGTGAYTLCRVLGLGPLSAAFGGTVFELSGPIVDHAGWPHTAVTCWSGWVLASVLLLVRGRHRVRDVALVALFVAMAVYGGHPESLAVLGVALLVFVVVWFFLRARWEHATTVRPVASLLVAGVCGLGLSAPLLLPGVQLGLTSVRNNGSGVSTFPLSHLPNLIATGLQGTDFRTAAYVGVIALALAVVGVCGGRGRPEVWALAVMTVVCAALTFLSPLAQVLHHIPGARTITWSRAAMLLALGVATLAAFGLDVVVRSDFDTAHASKAVARWALGGFAIVALFVVALVAASALGVSDFAHHRGSQVWPIVQAVVGLGVAGVLWWRARERGPSHARRRAAGRVGAVVLFALEAGFLMSTGASYWSVSSTYFAPVPAVTDLQRLTGSSLVGLGACPHGGRGSAASEVGIRPDANIGYGVREMVVYEPILPEAYLRSWAAVSGHHISRTLARLGIFCPRITTVDEARLYGVAFVLEPAGRPGPLGSAFAGAVGGEWLYSIPGAADATVVPLSPGPEPSMFAPGAAVPVTHPDPASWRVVVHDNGPGLLRLRLTDVPGWRATIDGRPLVLDSWAEGAMLEARLPAGRHVVELRYWPSLFSAGLVVGAVVAVGLGAAGAIATGWRRRRVATETVKAEVAGTVPSTR